MRARIGAEFLLHGVVALFGSAGPSVEVLLEVTDTTARHEVGPERVDWTPYLPCGVLHPVPVSSLKWFSACGLLRKSR